MDIQREEHESTGRGPVFDEGQIEGRPLSSQRLIYQAEIKVFREQHGGLENVRQKLGFSRRKMCQLLMVDPSAWTRWARDESKVPPHIYRSLEWFLALNQKALTHPDLAAIFKARYRVESGGAAATHATLNTVHLEKQLADLTEDLKRQKLISTFLILAIGALALSLAVQFLLKSYGY